uniref:LRRCT domain-containing protein n=1 Tax=Amphiprion percula TaxID=161767 RepID=A0A3P8SQ81_AMPPE
MTSVWLILLLPVITAQRVSPCPASCVVCSEDAVICQRLAHIIDAPDSTQALLLTEGFISTVQPASLSDLSNITVIGLSNNRISELGEESFKKLPFLHTLLLDHNLLTSQALQGGALINLTQLEVLALGHNLISMIQAGWFRGIKALRSLKLEGNLLTSLDSGSFPLNDLRELETLDLSDNLIQHMDKNSFRGLVSLKTLDLSRNRLSSAPVEDFSYLTLLTNLNLDLNSWNCSCQLLDLAAFLSTFMQQPDKTLYNGRRLVCVSADNPAVSTVLELTDANCVPSNQNITVQVETRDSVTPQLYARDLAITAVICFIGGVGLTLLMVLIYHQVSQRKKQKQSQRLKEEEEGNSTTANHLNHLDTVEGRRDVFLQENKEAMMLDTRNDVGQFRSRAEENSGYLRCPNCSTNGSRMNPMRRDNRMNGGMETEEDRERRRVRMMMEEDRRRTGFQQGILNRDTPNKFPPRGNMNSSSNPQRETFSQRTENLPPYKTGRDVDNHRTDVEAKSRGFETLHCESCYRTYRPPDQNMRQGRVQPNPRDSAMFDGFPPQHRQNDRGRNVSHHLDMMKNAESRRGTRNVTFDLERTLEQGSSRIEDKMEGKTSRDREKEKERRHKAQSSRLLKVKLNLNPLRKSKVHPKRKNEQRHSERSSPKKSKEKRRDGKEREEKEGRGKKAKSGSKSSKTEGSTEDGEEEGREKGKTSKHKKATSKSEQDSQERTESNVNKQPENSQPADSTDVGAPSATTAVTGLAQNLQNVQYQAAGITQLPSQHPFSLLAPDRSRTTNLSLLGSAGSQLTGSSLSLQGGNFLLNNNMDSGSNALFPSGPPASVAPGIALSGLSSAPGVTPDSRPAAAGLMSSGYPFLANTVHTNPLQASAVHATAPAANPAFNPVQSVSQSQMPPDSSPLGPRLKPDPVPVTPHQLPTESQPPPTKESLPVQGQDETSAVTPLNLEPVTTVENVSNNNSQTGTGQIPAGSTGSTSAGVVALTEGAEGGASGVASTLSTQSGSSTGAAANLLHQEYLSEEGGSSPRRKLRLVIPEKTSSRPPTALERKIR